MYKDNAAGKEKLFKDAGLSYADYDQFLRYSALRALGFYHSTASKIVIAA